MIRRCLNGETHMSKPHVSYSQYITVGREPGELKHKYPEEKKENSIPRVAASEMGGA